MFKRDGWSNQSRFTGIGGIVCMGLALMLSFASVTVVAQTAFEFEDPLEEIRSELQRKAAETENAPAVADPAVADPAVGEPATGWATDATKAASDTVTGATETVVSATDGARAQAAGLAERLGLPVGGLIGLLVLGLLAIGLGLYWLFSRRDPKRAAKSRKDRDLYAVANGSRARRTLDSGAKVTRSRTVGIDTKETVPTPVAGVAATAAKIISDEPLDRAEDDFVEAFNDQPAHGAVGTQDELASDPKDPDTWRRPNLDRLKASIRDEWKSDEEAPQAAEPVRTEAEAFAELFGEDDAPVARPAPAKSPVLDMLDTYEQAPDDMPLSALRSAVGGHAAAADAEDRHISTSTPLPSRADAVRRIKALRESVKAS